MLPGPRLVLLAIAATIVFVVLGFAQLVKLQLAQSQAGSLAPVEARFAGLAFAARADWIPVAASRAGSIEALPPFANAPPSRPRLDEAVPETAKMAKIAALGATDAISLGKMPSGAAAPFAETTPGLVTGPTSAEATETTPDGAELAADAPATLLAALTPPTAETAKPPLVPAAMAFDIADVLAAIGPAPAELVAPEVVIGTTEPDPAPSATGDLVPLPAPRPAVGAAPSGSKTAPAAAANKRATRTTGTTRRTAPAKGPQPAPAAPANNPFSALFGGSNSAGSARN